MERFQLSDIEFLLGLTPDSAVNTPKVLAAEYMKFRANSLQPPLPQLQSIPDQMVGDGTERSMVLRKGWWMPRTITIGGKANTESAARLGARALGGSITNTVVTAAQSWDHFINTQTKAQGRLPKLSSLIFLLGGYDFIWPTMGVQRFELNFDGPNDVNYVAELFNTGYWTRVSDLAPGAGVIDDTNIPVTTPHHLMHPAATRVTFDNGVVIDYATDGRLLSGMCSLTNNLVIRQLPGDPFIDPLDYKSGAYARDIHRGPREPLARLKVAMDSALAEFTMQQSGADITSLTYLFKGEDLIGASADRYEFEWEFPLAELESIQEDPDGDDAAITMNFYPKTDAVTGGYIIQRTRDGVATLA